MTGGSPFVDLDGRTASAGPDSRVVREGSKNRAGAIPRGGAAGVRNGRPAPPSAWPSDLTNSLNRITLRFDASVVTPWAEIYLRQPRRVPVRIEG
jgi:hypothetical protein